jgi:hypothetical protein
VARSPAPLQFSLTDDGHHHATLLMLLVSEHNVAELESALHLQPDEIWLFSTLSFDDAARRLQMVIKQYLPATEVKKLTSENHDIHRNASELAAWGKQNLRQQVDGYRQRGWYTILNITGGTKLIPMVFSNQAEWDALHYDAAETSKTQIWSLQEQRWLSDNCRTNVTIEQQLRLYLERVEQKVDKQQLDSAHSLTVAQLLHDASLASYRSHHHPWHTLDRLIRNHGSDLWHDRQDDKWHTQPITPAEFNELQAICHQLNQLGNFITLSQTTITLPTAKHKPSKAWREFIDGRWFEYLVAHWLHQHPPQAWQIMTNVDIYRDKEGMGQRDIDLVVRNEKKQLLLIELKVDTSDYRKDSGQLASLKDAVGAKLDSLLLCAPQYYRSIKDPAATQSRVKPSRIGLAFNREAVINLIKDKKSNWGPSEPTHPG